MNKLIGGSRKVGYGLALINREKLEEYSKVYWKAIEMKMQKIRS